MIPTPANEAETRSRLITPALEQAGWDKERRIREEYVIAEGRLRIHGKTAKRDKPKKADYVLCYKPNIPLAIVEAKDYSKNVEDGIQQALDYAKRLGLPFAFSSNGKGFLFHDMTGLGSAETYLNLDEFPTPDQLWQKYLAFRGLSADKEPIVGQPYFQDSTGRAPRYYQEVAINRTIEAIAAGRSRLLLVMATGTGKTYTAFQIAYRLWKVREKKRILFLADRTALIDQTRKGDFNNFGTALTTIKDRTVDHAYEVYLALYQGLTGSEEGQDIFRQFKPDFFDLVIVDECHRGSAKEDSSWREILNYFSSATQIGLTATPKETVDTSNSEYFGDPIYTYSLKQGIDDGFLAPYRVIRIDLNVDALGYRPEQGKLDQDGNPVEDREYNRSDYDRSLVIAERTEVVAGKITEFLKGYDRYAKTIVFCRDQEHASRMRVALINANQDLASSEPRYVVRITSDDEVGKRELENFTDVESRFPVIVTTSEMLTTGVDAKMCKVIVLEDEIRSMTKFKQIIGRGTRLEPDLGKLFFTILDFRGNTAKFADPEFDGDPVRVKTPTQDEDLTNILDQDVEATPDAPPEDSGESSDDTAPPQHAFIANDDGVPYMSSREKVYINGVDVSILSERTQTFNENGKLITASLKDYARMKIRNIYSSLDEFLQQWQASQQKTAILEELLKVGVPLEGLKDAVGRPDLEIFDLLCHVAYDARPLTRRERAEGVKKRNYFAKYGQEVREVLAALLDKYAETGIENIESIEVLKVEPISRLGGPVELLNRFGGKDQFMKAVADLEAQIYATV